MKKYWKYLIVLITALILYYFMLPAFNIHDYKFYFFVIILLVELLILSLPESFSKISPMGWSFFFKSSSASIVTRIILGLLGICFVYLLLTSIIFSPFFNSKAYATRINITDVEFSEVPENRYH